MMNHEQKAIMKDLKKLRSIQHNLIEVYREVEDIVKSLEVMI